jgi:competence protein ComEA
LKAENVRVRATVRLPALAAAAFFAMLAASPQSAPSKPAAPSSEVRAPEARVDINHATVEQLLKVPGITRSWAGRIIRFRPYWTKQELLDRGVVSSEVYDRIKDFIIAHRQPQ